MNFRQAFRITRGDVVAFIGAGGKTSTLVGSGYELAEAGWRVLATTTTRIGRDQLDLMPFALPVDASPDEINSALESYGFVFLYAFIRGEKVHGPPPEKVTELLDTVTSDVLLIEADGARGLPLKAPYDHEPVIPDETSLVVPIASLSVLGQPLDGEHVYNPDAINARYGFGEGNRVRSPWVAQVLRDETLGLRGIPPKARVIAFLNQTPAEGYMRGRARYIAQLMLRSPRLNGVAIGAARSEDPIHEVQRPIAAIVLAGGMSTRMGKSKVLLPWAEGRTIIEHIVQQLILARVDHICVVTGNRAEDVKRRLKPYDVQVVYNKLFKTGEMLSSLQTGIKALPAHIAAAMVVLGDQPRIQPRTVGLVRGAYARGEGRIVAPSYEMRRGHPILIDRAYWNELLDLPHNGAPRDVINAHADEIAYVVVENDSVLRDVDTPQQYQQERRKAGLS